METKPAYNDEDLLPVGKAAKIVGVHAQTLRNYESAGYISSKRTPGGDRRFRVADLVELRDNPPQLYVRKGPQTSGRVA